jgi:hypothetical protein
VNLGVFESWWQKLKNYLITKELVATKLPRHEETQSHVTFESASNESDTLKFNRFS